MTSCLCCILATISSNMRCRLFLAKRQLSQSGIVSMFCFPKTFSIKIMPSSLEKFLKIILILFSRISLSKFNDFSAGPNLKLHLSSLTLRYWQSLSDWGAAAIFTFLKRFHFSIWIALQKLKPKIREIDFLKVWFTFHINVVVKRNDN